MASRTRLYVGRLSTRTRERDLHDLFSRFGRIQSCDIKTGYGFVEFDDPRDAEDALHDLNNTTLDGSRIQVEFSKGPRQSGSRSSGGSARSDYRVSIDNLPREMSWQDLKDRFRQVGDVVFADVFHERGKFKGVVEFRSREDVKDAIRQLDGAEVRGSTIYVREDDGTGRSGRGGSRSPRRSSGGRRRSRSPRRSSPRRRYSRSPPRRRRSPSPERRRSRSRDRSPRGRSPRGRSPRGRSPRAASPKASPKASPRAASASPRSPRRGTNGDGNNSPRQDSSPRRRSSSPRRNSVSPPRRSPSRSPHSD